MSLAQPKPSYEIGADRNDLNPGLFNADGTAATRPSIVTIDGTAPHRVHIRENRREPAERGRP